MKIVITGATGFVGGAMMRYFSKKGHEVIGLGRNKELAASISKYGEFKEVDIRMSFPEIDADVCIHSAGLASDQALYKNLYDVNVTGTQNVFTKVNCKQFIHISSSSVYNFDQEIQQESDKIDPERLQPYGKTKRLAELYLEEQQDANKSISILRPRAIYGIGDRLLIPRILSKVKNGRLILPGDLKIETSLTHISNLVEAAEYCLAKNHSYEVYNVADRENYVLRDCIITILGQYFPSETKMIAFPLPIANLIAQLTSFLGKSSALNKMAIDNLSKNMILDTQLIHKDPDFQGHSSFGNSIDKVTEWLRSIDNQTLRNNSTALSWTNIDNFE